jgi:hypothetical protein
MPMDKCPAHGSVKINVGAEVGYFAVSHANGRKGCDLCCGKKVERSPVLLPFEV